MKRRQNGLSVVQDHLSVGVPDGLLDLGLVFGGVLAPFFRRRLGGGVGIAAVIIHAHIGIRVLRLAAGGHVVTDKGPLRHGLGVQGLLVEGGRHFSPDHPGQILRHGHLHHLLPVPHPQQNRPVGGALSRDCPGLSRVSIRDRPGRPVSFPAPSRAPPNSSTVSKNPAAQ